MNVAIHPAHLLPTAQPTSAKHSLRETHFETAEEASLGSGGGNEHPLVAAWMQRKRQCALETHALQKQPRETDDDSNGRSFGAFTQPLDSSPFVLQSAATPAIPAASLCIAVRFLRRLRA
jgi:hypothetical protein